MITFVKDSTLAGLTSEVRHPGEYWRGRKRLFQVEESAAGNITLEGRMDQSMPWEVITTISNQGYELVDVFPEMRVVTDSNTGNISVVLDASENDIL